MNKKIIKKYIFSFILLLIVDAGGGINGWGVDYCRSPDLNPESCYAISATRSWPPSNGANAYAGFDQYIQVGSWGW